MRQCSTTLKSELTVEERELLLSLLKRENFRGPHLEVGTAAGGTLCQMMLCFDDDQRPQFVAVDRMTYFSDQLSIVQRNLKHHGLDPDPVDFRVTTSSLAFHEAASKGETFDFILIDASHRILGVMADLRWSRLLRTGGILCLHDYAPRFPGVRLSVDRFLGQNSNYSIIDQAGTLLAMRKDAISRIPEVTTFDRAYSMMWYLPLEAQRKIHRWKERGQQARRAA